MNDLRTKTIADARPPRKAREGFFATVLGWIAQESDEATPTPDPVQLDAFPLGMANLPDRVPGNMPTRRGASTP